jgi:hypothetical protein
MIKKECAECRKSFDVDDSKRNWQSVKLCSPECQREVTNRKVRESYTPQTWPQKGECAWCGKEFLKRTPGQKKKQYCDRRCRTKKLRNDREIERASEPPKVCVVCSKEFRPHKLAKNIQLYCSDKCKIKEQYRRHPSLRQNRKGQASFSASKKVVLERDGNRCTLCDSTYKLNVHHRDNSGGSEYPNNNPDNLATLCRKHHHQFHRINLVYVDGEWFVSGPALSVFDGESIKILR